LVLDPFALDAELLLDALFALPQAERPKAAALAIATPAFFMKVLLDGEYVLPVVFIGNPFPP
jgi:hypothetical protein